MEFLVKNRVFEDFKIEFLPKIEFFDFWQNRVFVKWHKKACLEQGGLRQKDIGWAMCSNDDVMMTSHCSILPKYLGG